MGVIVIQLCKISLALNLNTVDIKVVKTANAGYSQIFRQRLFRLVSYLKLLHWEWLVLGPNSLK